MKERPILQGGDAVTDREVIQLYAEAPPGVRKNSDLGMRLNAIIDSHPMIARAYLFGIGERWLFTAYAVLPKDQVSRG